jgi:hypothetical protein
MGRNRFAVHQIPRPNPEVVDEIGSNRKAHRKNAWRARIRDCQACERSSGFLGEQEECALCGAGAGAWVTDVWYVLVSLSDGLRFSLIALQRSCVGFAQDYVRYETGSGADGDYGHDHGARR